MFVVCKVQDFKVKTPPFMQGWFPQGITIDTGKMVGYLPAYETREDALADFPDAKLMEIEKVNEQ